MPNPAKTNAKTNPQIILDVPFYSQFEKNNGLDNFWQQRSCGILALKMVMDYNLRQAGQELVELPQLLEVALDAGGVNQDQDWYHSTLVKTAQNYGFNSWRRSWMPSEKDVEHFRKEGVGEDSIAAWRQQTQNEALASIAREISNHYPLIVSANPNFREETKSHLLTLTGVCWTEESKSQPAGFYYNDPYNQASEKTEDSYAPLEKFKNGWTYRAIFVRSKS